MKYVTTLLLVLFLIVGCSPNTYNIDQNTISDLENSEEKPAVTKTEPVKKCTEKWSCTDWEPEECPKTETQTRSCTDLNKCNSDKNKSSEKRTCSYVEEPKTEIEKKAEEQVEVKQEVVEEPKVEEKSSSTSDILEALEKTKEALENYQTKTSKLDECTRTCAGDEYDIPVYRTEWYSTCSQIYYYTGEKGLDEQIAKCGN